MECVEKFKNDVFHLSLGFKNRALHLMSLGETVDTNSRRAIFRYAMVCSRVPTTDHLEAVNRPKVYSPSGLSYANDVAEVHFQIERYASLQEFQSNRNPFEFRTHSLRKKQL